MSLKQEMFTQGAIMRVGTVSILAEDSFIRFRVGYFRYIINTESGTKLHDVGAYSLVDVFNNA